VIPLYVLIAACIAVVAADVIVRVRRKPVAPARRDWGGEVRHAHAAHAAAVAGHDWDDRTAALDALIVHTPDADDTPPFGIPRPR